MRKTACILLLLILPSLALGEVTRKITEKYDLGRPKTVTYYDGSKEIAKEYYSEDGPLTKKTGFIPDGIVREYFSNGKIKYEGEFKGNKRNGIIKEYDEKSGKLYVTFTCVNDKREGECREYKENGELKNTIMFRDNKPVMQIQIKHIIAIALFVLLVTTGIAYFMPKIIPKKIKM